MRFFDTSAVVKRYVQEEHSASVRASLTPSNAVVSRLTEVEVASAIARCVRLGELSAAAGEEILSNFRADLPTWAVVELTPPVASTAVRLLWQHALTAGDAIQLASALEFGRELGRSIDAFVVYDRRLAEAARREHLTVIGG